MAPDIKAFLGSVISMWIAKEISMALEASQFDEPGEKVIDRSKGAARVSTTWVLRQQIPAVFGVGGEKYLSAGTKTLM